MIGAVCRGGRGGRGLESGVVDATVTPLTDVQVTWIREQLAAAAQFTADYGADRTLTGLAAVDHAWASWLDRQAVDPEDPDTVINAVAVYLGQSIVETLPGFEWVLSLDDDGSDLAVLGLPGALDLLVFPADLVAKGYQSRTAPLLEPAHASIVDQVGRLRP